MIKVMTISLFARFAWFDSTPIDIELNQKQKFDLLNKEWRRTAIISN